MCHIFPNLAATISLVELVEAKDYCHGTHDHFASRDAFEPTIWPLRLSVDVTHATSEQVEGAKTSRDLSQVGTVLMLNFVTGVVKVGRSHSDGSARIFCLLTL